MGRFFAQVTMLANTGQSRDNQVNGFAAGSIGSVDGTFATQWTSALTTFYNALRTAGALRGLAQNDHLVKIYDIAAARPNYPLFERTFNLTSAPGTVEMPEEVALCISYANTSAVTIPRGRRRGRIFISGWQESANTDGRPTSTAINNSLTAFTDYVTTFNALGTLDASIWSRVNESTQPIQTAFVDNEWDTQRRRGGRATSRATWTLP